MPKLLQVLQVVMSGGKRISQQQGQQQLSGHAPDFMTVAGERSRANDLGEKLINVDCWWNNW